MVLAQHNPRVCNELAEKLDSTAELRDTQPMHVRLISIPPGFFRFSASTVISHTTDSTMPGEPAKRTKREEYRQSLLTEDQNGALPKKRFYRQRAHANPFSDHSLT